MSTQGSGFGGKAVRPSEFESDFADRQNAADAPGNSSWNANAANTEKSEVPYMVQGAGRPGQPNFGQRSIFGNGGPAFTQMPTYTPVTRGPAEPPAAPQPQAAPQPPQQPSYPPQTAGQRPQAPAPQAYQAPQQPQPQSFEPQGFGAKPQYQPQAYPPQDLPDLSNADPGFPDSIFGDFKSADASFPDNDFSDQSGADQSYADASFPDQGDASFADASFSTGAGYGADEALSGGDDQAYQAAPASHAPQAPMAHPQQAYQPQTYQPQAYQPQAYQPQAPQPQAYQPQAPQSDPRRQLQAFDAVYDQPPQIALGGRQSPAPAPQEYLEADRGDADFLDESQLIAPPSARSKLANSLRGRSAFMVASALLGAIALGGALAFAYKQSGGSMGSGETPIVTADARPVKEVPDQPGGKEFPHKNKLIYDRLTNGNEPESERLVPRQEDVAVPALPPATATAGLPAPVASTDLANPATTQSVDGADEDGGPRKVKTLVVRPDGSVEAPPADAAPAEAAPVETAEAAPAGVMPVPAPEAPPAPMAAAPMAAAPAAAAPMGAVPMPAAPAAAAPAPQQVAAADPAPAPAAPSKYVVQVGAHKSQTEALAIYADIQQKNPSLLGNYPPIVQKATLNSGTMYRLRVGPMDNKSAADKLCGQLKTQGTDCFVVAQ